MCRTYVPDVCMQGFSGSGNLMVSVELRSSDEMGYTNFVLKFANFCYNGRPNMGLSEPKLIGTVYQSINQSINQSLFQALDP